MPTFVNRFHPEGRRVDVAASVLRGGFEARGLENVTRGNIHEGHNAAARVMTTLRSDFDGEDLGVTLTHLDNGIKPLEIGVAHTLFVFVETNRQCLCEVVNHGNTLAGFPKKSTSFLRVIFPEHLNFPSLIVVTNLLASLNQVGGFNCDSFGEVGPAPRLTQKE